jgi:predicted nucleotidyltransferase
MELITEPLEKALASLKESWAEYQNEVKYSDVDLALDCNGKPVSDTLKFNISSLFEKSILPYTVDIIDLNSVSPVFRKKIEKDFVKIM